MKTKKILGIALAACMTMGLTAMPTMAEVQENTCIWMIPLLMRRMKRQTLILRTLMPDGRAFATVSEKQLFRYSDTMEIEPWIAKEYENVDELTWKITLNDGVVFSKWTCL